MGKSGIEIFDKKWIIALSHISHEDFLVFFHKFLKYPKNYDFEKYKVKSTRYESCDYFFIEIFDLESEFIQKKLILEFENFFENKLFADEIKLFISLFMKVNVECLLDFQISLKDYLFFGERAIFSERKFWVEEPNICADPACMKRVSVDIEPGRENDFFSFCQNFCGERECLVFKNKF